MPRDESLIEGVSAIALACAGDPRALTGSVALTTLATVTLPGRLLGPHGSLRVSVLATCTNNANNKTLQLSFGGQTFGAFTGNSYATFRLQYLIQNRGSEQSQVAPAGSCAFGDNVTTAAGLFTYNIDTTINQPILIQGQLANAGDLLTLERYLIEVLRG